MKILNISDLIEFLSKKIKWIMCASFLFTILFLFFQYEYRYSIEDNVPQNIKNELEQMYSERENVENLTTSRVFDMNESDFYMVRISLEVVDCNQKLRREIEEWMFKDKKVPQLANSDLNYLEYKYLTSRWSDKSDNGVTFYFDFKTDNSDDIDKFNYAIHIYVQDKTEELRNRDVECYVDDYIYHMNSGEQHLKLAIDNLKNEMEVLQENVSEKELSMTPEKYKYYCAYFLNKKLEMSKQDLCKYAISGFLISFVISIILFTIKYLFDGRLKISDEIEMVYHLKILDADNPHDDLFIIRDSTTDYQEAALYSENESKIMQNVAIVVQLKKTKYKSLEKELQYCEDNGIAVHGVVLV